MREVHFYYVSESQRDWAHGRGVRVCLQNTTDYSPFGVTLDGRTIERDFYRRGFNGMEKDDEVKGEGNSYDFGARKYDSRVGRWMSVDPLYFKYAAFSTYSFCYNNPMIVVDKDGKEGIVVSGSPGDHDNKKHFLVNGLDRAISAKNHTKRKGEIVTWIIYDDPTEGQGYTGKTAHVDHPKTD